MQRSDFRCVHRLRVRWAEVDMQKIVFNAHYLMYIDNAMSDYWRALALPYEASMLALGGESDLNVPVRLNVPALEANLPKNKKNVVKTYPGLSHMLQHNPTGDPGKSAAIEETIVLNACVTETNVTSFRSNTSTSLAKSIRDRERRSIL